MGAAAAVVHVTRHLDGDTHATDAARDAAAAPSLRGWCIHGRCGQLTPAPCTPAASIFVSFLLYEQRVTTAHEEFEFWISVSMMRVCVYVLLRVAYCPSRPCVCDSPTNKAYARCE